MKILTIFLFMILVNCGKTYYHTMPIIIDIQKINRHNDFLVNKSNCFKDSLLVNTLSNKGLFIATITNSFYDRVHINLSEYLCDSVPILFPEKIFEYVEKDSGLVLVGSNLIFNSPVKQHVEIGKGDSAIIILDAGRFTTNCNYIESFYPMDVDSMGVRIAFQLRVSHSEKGSVSAIYFLKSGER